jgi:16S rRNA processing protein RimM
MPSPHLLLGRIVKPWGLKGEVRLKPYADSAAIAAGLAAVQIGPAGGDLAWYTIERLRRMGSSWILKLSGVETIEQASRLVGCEVLVPRSAVPPLPEGMYYHADLIGLQVQSEEGRVLGRIVEILETGANDVFVVHSQQGEWLLPATREVVRKVDLAGQIVLVRPLEGMIDAEAV